jgi:hypothetical protein
MNVHNKFTFLETMFRMPVIVMLTVLENVKWSDGSADSIAVDDDEANMESLRTSAEMICDWNLNIASFDGDRLGFLVGDRECDFSTRHATARIALHTQMLQKTSGRIEIEM